MLHAAASCSRNALCTIVLALSGLATAAPTATREAPPPAPSQFKVDAWQTEQGLPQNTVQSVFQSSTGHLWVGTTGGLARFDGYRFTPIETPAAPQLASRPIFGFMEDRDGTLWIGHSAGAARYRDGRFEQAFPSQLIGNRRVWAFVQDADGSIWAASEAGLLHWKDGPEQPAIEVYNTQNGFPHNRVRTLAFDRDGTLWIGTTGGGLVAMREGKFQTYTPANGFPHLEVRHLLADPEGGIWAATPGPGLVHLRDGHQRIYGTADGLPTGQLTFLTRDKSGALWIGTWGAGVVRFQGGKFESIASADGLSGDQIWSLHCDRDGGLWIGTWHGGLNRLSARYFQAWGKPEGLSHDNTRSVLIDRQGAVWTATAGGGVNRIADGKVTQVTTAQGLASNESAGLHEAADGAMWITSYTGGVARYQNGKVRNYGLKEGLPALDARVVFQDRAGTVWVGTHGGLARLEGAVFKALRPPDWPGAPTESITWLHQDRTGTLWVGTAGQGLFRFRDGKFSVLTSKEGLASNWPLAMYEDADGVLWVGSNGDGLTRIAGGQLTAIRPEQGLWDGVVQSILEDRQGQFWITCNRGFFRVARSDLNALAQGRLTRVRSMVFGAGDGLRNITFASGVQPNAAIDGAGRLWLPSLKGLVVVDPAHLPNSGSPPAALISEVVVNGEPRSPRSEVSLPPGSLPLALRYSADTLQHVDRVRFRYRLEGLNERWIDAGKSREAIFAALPNGRYTFRVSASLDGDAWNDSGPPLSIRVAPHYYETAWFLLLMLSLAGVAAISIFRFRTHQLRVRQANMERLIAEKTEALRQANEHLSNLSFADALTGLANRRRLDEALESEWRRAARSGTPLALVMADIDAFKAYNDTLGHPAGDACLVAVAQVIRDSTQRAGDFAARYGGEEFVILLPGFDRNSAMAFAEGVRAACEARAIAHPASPVGKVVTVSLGVASCIPDESRSPLSLIADADAALYRAKFAGRNRVA